MWQDVRIQVGRDRVFCITTGWTIRCSIPGGGESFLNRPEWLWGPHNLLYNTYRVPSPVTNRLGRGVNHPPPFSAEVKERVELYLFSTLCLKIVFFRKSGCLWDNVENYCTAGQAADDSIIRSMRTVLWITKATHTLVILNNYCIPSSTMVMRMRLNVTSYVRCLSYFLYTALTEWFL
jgi:hypothetical protein